MFAVLAIILTTFMFTTVFSIGFSLGKNMNIMMLREQGTNFKGWRMHTPERSRYKNQYGNSAKQKEF